MKGDALAVCALIILSSACERGRTAAPWVELRAGSPVDAFTPRDSGMPDVPSADASVTVSDAAMLRDARIDGSGPNAMTVGYRTHSQGGAFAPRNVGAAWIERGDGTWVKTLEAWATIRARYLYRFNTACDGNRVDAISRATLRDHELHENTWNLRDVQDHVLPEGDYRVVIEVTDMEAAGASIALPFVLEPGATGATTFPSTPFFSDLVVSVR